MRALRNILLFVVADDGKVEDMRDKMARRLALRDLRTPNRLNDLAEHQQAKVRELEARSETDVAIAIQQCYRHIFYPSRTRPAGFSVDLAHAALDIHSASEKPGAGQQQVVRALREYLKLRAAEDEPDAPAYTRDNVAALKRGQITTAALRDEFRRDPRLPMLVGDDIFLRGIRKGIEQSEYVYRRAELVYEPGDPLTSIVIDEQAVVFTMAYAKDHGILPRPKPQPEHATPADGPPAAVQLNYVPGGFSGAGFLSEAGPMSPTPGAVPANDASVLAGPPSVSAEGVLREALVRLWEQARAKKIGKVGVLSIRMFDVTDAFRLLGVVAAVRGADRKVATIAGEYETKDGSTFEVSFTGTPQDAQPLKDFLEPQLRAAAEKDVKAKFVLHFSDGLSLDAASVDKMTEQLTRFATGAAYVEATAEAKP